MGHVNKDVRNGNWVARWRDPSGRGRSKTFARKVDAERFLSQLTAELDAAVRDGRIARNPASGMALPRRVRSEPRFLTAVEVGRLAQGAGPYRLAVLILAFTGVRFGELVALRVKRVDAARRRITIA